MSSERSPRPIVFAGPSLSPREIRETWTDAIVLPPAARDDLYRARESGANLIVLIDGVFAHQLAVSPREVVEVVRDGAKVVGASSMGAVRAADCGPVGMLGVGLVYRLFRTGVLEGDDEVAVCTNPEADYAATSTALVNVRCALARARRAGMVDRDTGARILNAAVSLYFADRTWPAIFQRAGLSDNTERLKRYCEAIDVKRDDAIAAVRFGRELSRRSIIVETRPSIAAFARTKRYEGHDPLFGEDPSALRRMLCEWLLGSGRYERYIWPLAVGEPEFTASPLPSDEHERHRELRKRLRRVLTRLLQDSDRFAERLWCELECLGRLQTELMRWHACHALAAAATTDGRVPSRDALTRAFQEIGYGHGHIGLPRIVEHPSTAIPVEWMDRAARQIALARTYVATRDAEGSSAALHQETRVH